MPSRLVVLCLGLFLSFGLSACSKKPANSANTTTSSTDATNTQNAPDTLAQKATVPTAEKSKPQVKPVLLPAGTILTVRISEAVGSKISQPGQTFAATLAQPVEVAGKTVIPAGSEAAGVIADAKPLGRFKGGASLELKLNSISIHGTDHPIETTALARNEKGKGKRTAAMAGGGAGLGALIGGLAGGGKGAAIGALAGAGAGTGGAAFTGNKDVLIPAESAL
ncbi:MAG: hypothetical protein JO266_04750, partial [Acidobacteria bacterium]|nr:hypothetical protein [Acidobacteriota bacterium]